MQHRIELTIKQKLIFGLSLCAVAMLAVGTFGFIGQRESHHAAESIYVENMGSVLQIARTRNLLMDNRVAVNAMLVRRQPALVKGYVDGFEQRRTEINRAWSSYYPAHVSNDIERQAALDFIAARKQVDESLSETLRMAQQNDFEGSTAYFIHEAAPRYDRLLTAVDRLFATNESQAQVAYEASGKAFGRTQTASAAAIAIGMALMIGMMVALLRAISRPIERAITLADEIAAGHLDHGIVAERQDEVGRLLRALASMDGTLTRIVGEVRDSSQAVSHAAQQIADGNTDLSQRTQWQASSLEETAASVEELTATVRQTAENAAQAARLMRESRTAASQGSEVATQASTAMKEIHAASQRVTDIVSAIDEIAFQTNLLALNAAVEAARAGEQGRGFAVVATEVRQLAQRSAAAAREARELISDAGHKVEVGGTLVEQSANALQNILGSVKKADELMAEIAAASSQQSAGIEQINQTVTQLDDATQQNAALVEESAAASQSMRERAELLRRQVSFFQRGTRQPLAEARHVASSGRMASARA